LSRPTYFVKIWVPLPNGEEMCSRTFRMKAQVADESQSGPLLDLEFKRDAEMGKFGDLSKKMVEEYGGYEKLSKDWTEKYNKSISAMQDLVDLTEEMGLYESELKTE
jgi:hypothetical protein